MLSDSIIKNISHARMQIYFSIIVSFVSIIIVLYMIYLILKNFFNIISQYNLKVNKKTVKTNKIKKDTRGSDDYQYDKSSDLYKQNENINKKIIRTLEKANKDQSDTLDKVTKLKQNLKVKDTINSSIDTKIFSEKDDDLKYYNEGGSSFFSKLFYTQQRG